jgi:hypothetical protein
MPPINGGAPSALGGCLSSNVPGTRTEGHPPQANARFPEAAKKSTNLGSPRPNEGIGVRGAVHAASSPEEPSKRLSRCGKTSARCHGAAIPLTPQPLSPLGRGEPQSNLISILSHLPLRRGIIHSPGDQRFLKDLSQIFFARGSRRELGHTMLWHSTFDQRRNIGATVTQCAEPVGDFQALHEMSDPLS